MQRRANCVLGSGRPQTVSSYVEVPGAASDLRPAPPDSRRVSPTMRTAPEASGAVLIVEVPGIEPGSNGVYQILLRAQSCCGVFSLAGLYDPSANTAYPLLDVPHTPSSKGAW